MRMWDIDPRGTALDGPDTAREELRHRAQLAIGAGLKQGSDLRGRHVRLRDGDGAILFEGTLAEAAAADLALWAPVSRRSEETLAERSRRLCLETRAHCRQLRQRRTEVANTVATSWPVIRESLQLIDRLGAWMPVRPDGATTGAAAP